VEGAPLPRRARRRRLLVVAAACLVALLAFELVARVGSWLVHGFDPYYLFYGFVSWTDATGEGHSDKFDGYFKYPPNSTLHNKLPEPGRINNHGFRGADFEVAKAPGTFRVVCMGGSSTFGYRARDQGTYPVLLQQLFDARPAGMRVEVINAGIAHLNSDHQVALVQSEVLDWQPDVITLYLAYNDAFYPRPESRWQAATKKADEYSAAFASLRKATNALFGDVIVHQWTVFPLQSPPEQLALQIELHRERTRTNLETIAELALARGTRIVVARQPMTVWYQQYPDTPRAGLTYEDEVAGARARLEQNGAVDRWDAVLLVHRALLEEIDAFAARHGFPVVDNVALIDAHPDGLATYVHLTEAANARLAQALHDVLAPLVHAGDPARTAGH
jgi:lysophospholipase L1-like esterase